MRKKNPRSVLSPVGKIHGTADVPHRKNTAESQTVIMPPPEFVTIPMQQHIGAPCVPCVKPGQEVKVGTLIGNSDAYMSVPIHSSVSGTVMKITEVILPSGSIVKAVQIKSDGLMTLDESIAPVNIESTQDIINAARTCGLVGLGGAGFPAHVKLNPKEGTIIDTLIVNAAECEPYITSDYRECVENPKGILDGINMLLKHYNFKSVIIAVEENKPRAIEILSKIAATDDDCGDRIKVMELESSYPQGAEKVLIKAVTGRSVPPGKLPSDVRCIVMNVTSVALLHSYITTGVPLVSKRVTVDGSSVKNPCNVRVPLGTSVADLMGFCGGYISPPKKILMGGPMMGLALTSDDTPIMKQNNAILAFNSSDSLLPAETACIRCGRCVDVCPMSLMPTQLVRFTKSEDAKSLVECGINTCMECGCCAYVCPAHRQLVQTMRLAKSIVRKAGKK